MKKLILSIALLCPLAITGFAQSSEPAHDQAIVMAGDDVRFTVLTPGIIRMEWAPDGKFTDDASFIFVNRRVDVPEFTAKRSGRWLVITTDRMELRYKTGSGKFTADNLSVKSLRKASHRFEWKPGQEQKGNLKGTYRTLDRYDGDWEYRDKTRMPIEDGLLATDGWTLIDDSSSLLFDDSDWAWVKTRPEGERQDWYFMGYGRDYKGILGEFTAVAGKSPLPPRYAFGYWWSRYWAYSDKEIRSLVENMDKFNIPLDVLVIDMDWHRTDSVNTRDEFGQRKYWTGWTWNRDLFPAPEKLLGWLGDRNLKKTLNLHPASGIAPFEEMYGEFAARMDFDTSTGRNIPWQGSDKKFIKTLFDVILRPMEKQGVDFWWLDWQQWIYDKKIGNLSNTWWLNYIFFTEMERNREVRPMLYHRWGGLGNHRYQIGFSGDAIITWNSLEFQPYFTNCASNVLYGYWSHDLGGHMFMPGQEKVLDPELYTRWMQYGVFSPIFRTHSTKDATLNKEIWNFRGEYYDALAAAIDLRYELVPYIYTAARDCYETGISLCRPMYYDYPDAPQAYDFDRQFMFGDDMLIAPIGAAMRDGYSTVKVWLPAGNDWFEWHSGTLLKGGQTLERKFPIDEYPVYIRAGAVIPMYEDAKNLDRQPSTVRIALFPGGAGSGLMYEDNGNDKHYAGQHAWTKIRSENIDRDTFRVTIEPREGDYAEMPASRRYVVQLYGAATPRSVTVNGRAADFSYTGESLRINIDLGQVDCSERHEIVVAFYSERPELNDGLVRRFKRLTKATTQLKFDAAAASNRGPLPQVILDTEATDIKLEYFPERFNELIGAFRGNLERIPDAVTEAGVDEDAQQRFLRTAGF